MLACVSYWIHFLLYIINIFIIILFLFHNYLITSDIKYGCCSSRRKTVFHINIYLHHPLLPPEKGANNIPFVPAVPTSCFQLLFIVLRWSVISLLWISFQSDEVADTIRSFAQLEGCNPTVAILDPCEQRVYSLPDSSATITRSDIENLIAEFKQSAVLFDPMPSLFDSW